VRAVITEAAESMPEQLRRREVRYASMMGLRAVCLIVAVVVTAAKVPYAMVWVGLCLVGMILLPWAAVLIANDRAPKKSSQFRSHFATHQERALPSAQPVGDAEPSEQASLPRVLEHRPDE
jgi:Flp pilus assembly protein TadB